MGLRLPPSGFTDRTAARGGVRYASWLRRAGGLLLDGLLIGMMYYLLAGLMALFVGPVTVHWVVLFLLVARFDAITIIYATLCLAKLHGQTPGMRVMQIRCVPSKGHGILTMPQALTRAITAAVIVTVPWLLAQGFWLPALVESIAYLWPLIERRRQTWWDYLAATIVLDDRGW